MDVDICDICSAGDMVKWDAPDDFEIAYEFIHICNRCGHTFVSGARLPHAEGQGLSMLAMHG
jgi:hypothetical protein